jgi:hypothetical protein
MSKKELRECEVVIRVKIPKNKMKDLYAAIDALNKAGITFDTGGTCSDPVQYDLEFDWSLKGAKVFFKRFKDEETENE